jgi:hypothetical protein
MGETSPAALVGHGGDDHYAFPEGGSYHPKQVDLSHGHLDTKQFSEMMQEMSGILVEARTRSRPVKRPVALVQFHA